MKAAVLTGIKGIEVRELPDPVRISERDVLLRTAAVGICGSDLHYYSRGRIGDQAVAAPFTIGHECSGVVMETGAQAGDLRPGDRIAVDPAVSCGSCDQCRAGRPHTCRRLRFMGNPGQLSGCLAESLVLPAANCHPLPRQLSAVEGAMIEPFSIGLYALELWRTHSTRFFDSTDEADIAILGSGPIGLSLLLAARAAGVSSILATDPISARRRIAGEKGAAWTGRPDEKGLAEGRHPRFPAGLDAVFECCGDPAALDQAVSLLKPGGALVIVGIPGQNRVSFDINRLRRGEISILNVRRQNRCTAAAIDLAASGRVDLSFLATHRFSLEDVAGAFELASNYRDGVLRAVIDFSLS